VNTIITAADVLEGDKIKATFTNGTRTESYEGVANHFDTSHYGKPRWRTADDYALFTDRADVIELLERPKPKIELPKPKIELPTGKGAVVKYNVASFDPVNPERVAIRGKSGTWAAFDPSGDRMDTHLNNANFAEWLADFTHEVVFVGAAK
jgi:hypothetical protein